MKRVRLVTFAWGQSYVAAMLDYALAAILAPGNLPALVAEFNCDVLLLAERNRFDQIKAHPTYARLQKLCPVRLVEIDDLIVAPLYGLALTYACYRAFEDLGDNVSSTALLYFNSDWILADGAYQSLIPHIRAGERLVVSPTYCVATERVMPKIQDRLAEGAGVLAIPKREMADWSIRYRHNTIRGKTVNRPLFHMDVIEQFYWRVDAKTLLCHQMPIAIVCISPERIVRVPETFWDYGTVSELCPNATPKVLADSDEFLIMELRGEETYSEGLRVGWPSIADIGRQLATFVTKDHLDYGRFQLCLHSGDLPPTLDEARQQLRRVVDEVYRYIPAPKDHIAHPYWWPQQALFEFAHRSFRNTDAGRRSGFRASPLTHMLLGEVERLDGEFETLEEPHRPHRVNAALKAISGSVDQLEGLFISDLNALRKALLVRRSTWHLPRGGRVAARSNEPTTLPARPQARRVDFLRSLVRALRDWVNNALHLLHPERALAIPLLREIPPATGKEESVALVVCSQGHALAMRTLHASHRDVDLAAPEALLRWRSWKQGDRRWSLVVFELTQQEMSQFRMLLRAALPRVNDGGKVFLFHPHGRGPLSLDRATIVNIFPPSDRLAVKFSGSRLSELAVRIYDRARQLLPQISVKGFDLTSFAAVALAGPISLIANLRSGHASGEDPTGVRATCAGMLMSLPIDGEVRAELDGW